MTRKPMSEERVSITHRIRIGDDLKGFITVGLYENGAPGEVFLTVKQVGTLERGLCSALALMISLALQHGVPVKKISEKLQGLKFEPAGFTKNTDIPSCHSISDYIGKWLELKFVKEKQ